MAYDLEQLPEDMKRLKERAERLGFDSFWYHPDAGLYAYHPKAHMEDDRMPITDEHLKWHERTLP